jgi:hypothetical protein
VQPHTNCQGSKQFPNFALFTTLLGRVRLSQSVGYKTNSIVARKTLPEIGFNCFEYKDWVLIFGASNPSIDATSHPRLAEGRGFPVYFVKGRSLTGDTTC